MTGAEVIIIQNGNGVLGKVRADGYQVEDYLIAQAATFQGTPQELWKSVMDDRISQGGRDQFDQDEIESKYRESGFPFEVPPGAPCAFSTLSEAAENQLVAVLPDGINSADGYLCGYTDLIYVIDLDRVGENRVVEHPED